MSIVNLGILAHVDAGKTSLTERLLQVCGVIDEAGSVDDGSTQTDSMALERQRGITIRSAVVSFVVGDTTINLIDTPGHPDFIAEVERALGVLDGVVLVVSAVEGVQAQTRVLMRALQRLRLPVLIFVNKIDRRGAQQEPLLTSIREKLSAAIVPLGRVNEIGSRTATFVPATWSEPEAAGRLAETLAGQDDAILTAYLDDGPALPPARLRAELARQSRRGLVHPVFFGSAITGAGVETLATQLAELLPHAPSDLGCLPDGVVFKVERGANGEKLAYVRMFAGVIRERDRLEFGGGREGKVTAISVFERGGSVRHAPLEAGQIGRVQGLDGVRIGDRIGTTPTARGGQHFAPPTLETIVTADDPDRRGDLQTALMQLAEQDPLIGLRHDGVRHETSVSLYGEVQKEVIQATLATDFGIDVSFRETTTICIESPAGIGNAAEFIDTPPNPFFATVGLRVEPGPAGSGIGFRLEVELGSMPSAFFTAIEVSATDALRQGLHGWQVVDCAVVVTHCGYWPRQSHAHGTFDKSMSSTAADFRYLTPLVLMTALQQAGSTVYEPVHRFHLDVPADTLTAVFSALARLQAVPFAPEISAASCRLDGEIPAAQVHRLQQQLPGLTRGEGVLESAFDSYQKVRGAAPGRSRTDLSPVDRRVYLPQAARLAGRDPLS